MGQEKQVSRVEGQVRRSWLLGSVIHQLLRRAHLAGIETATREAGPDSALSNEGVVEARDPRGVDR